MYNRRKPKSVKHKQQISRGLKRYWKKQGVETATVIGVSAITGAGLLLGKKHLIKNIENAAEKGFRQGAKEGVKEMAPQITVTLEKELVKAKPEIITGIKQGISEGLQRKSIKEAGQLELQQLRKNRTTTKNDSLSKRFKSWVAYKKKEGVAGRKKNLGFNKAYSDNFWIKFNSRKTNSIEFAKKRKPMSEETKRKISRSVARSKGRTAGYDTDKVNQPRGNSLDRGIDSIGKLTKAVNPILRYINEKDRLTERKKRRKIQAINTTIYGLGTGSRILSTANSGRLARQRLASRENLLDKTLRSREGIEAMKAENRIKVENIKQPARIMTANAYAKQPRMTAANILSNPKRAGNLSKAERDALRDVVLGR